MTLLALVAAALAPSLIVLAMGISLTAFRVARERRASQRPARSVRDRPDNPSVPS